MKLALIIGHDPLSQGAKAYNDMSEWAWNMSFVYKNLAPHLMLLTDMYEIMWRNPGDYHAESARLAKLCSLYQIDLVLEFHFNAFDGSTPIVRAESLLVDNEEAKKFTYMWLKEMKETYSLTGKETRLKMLEPGDRGFAIVNALNDYQIPCVIMEPFFGDTENRLASNIMNFPEEYASVVARTVAKFQGLDI